jgi:signal transduction histidine kinase
MSTTRTAQPAELTYAPIQLAEEYEELLSTALTEAMLITGANCGHLALVDLENGELVVHQTVGEAWTPERARLRIRLVNEEGRGIIAHVATTGQSYRTGDAPSDPYYLALFGGVHSELCVPILDRNKRTLGVINLESAEPEAFDEKDEQLVAELATRCGLALSAAFYSARLQALIEVGRRLSEVRDIRDLLDTVAEVATHILRAADCSLFLFAEGRQQLVLQASHGHLAGSLDTEPPKYAVGYGLTGWVAQNAQSVNTDAPAADPRWRGLYSELSPEHVGSFLAVPIVGRDEVLGVIRAVRRRTRGQAFVPDEFTESDEQLLWTLASQVGVALDNARLFDRALQAERLAAWGELSARAQHMIGNVVFGLKGNVGELDYLLSGDEVDREGMREVAHRAQAGLHRLESIMQEFRDFVMATRLSPEPLDLNALVRETVRATVGGQDGLEVSLELADEVPRLRGDSSKLRAALGELLENAVAAQGAPLRISVSTRRATPADLKQFGLAAQDESFLRVSVADTGPGVHESARQRLFSPFFSTKSQGMGLGLSIVRGIVEAHRGYIQELGEAGQGADFVILLPINSGPARPGAGAEPTGLPAPAAAGS